MRVTDVTDKAVKLELEAPRESISPIRLTAAPMCPEYLCGMTLTSCANIVFKLCLLCSWDVANCYAMPIYTTNV